MADFGTSITSPRLRGLQRKLATDLRRRDAALRNAATRKYLPSFSRYILSLVYYPEHLRDAARTPVSLWSRDCRGLSSWSEISTFPQSSRNECYI